MAVSVFFVGEHPLNQVQPHKTFQGEIHLLVMALRELLELFL